jgi:hypothetical protein
MTHINPSAEQFKEFSSRKDDGPFVMINLLKFRKKSDKKEETGINAYNRYMEHVAPLLDEAGGRLFMFCRVSGCKTCFINPYGKIRFEIPRIGFGCPTGKFSFHPGADR